MATASRKRTQRTPAPTHADGATARGYQPADGLAPDSDGALYNPQHSGPPLLSAADPTPAAPPCHTCGTPDAPNAVGSVVLCNTCHAAHGAALVHATADGTRLVADLAADPATVPDAPDPTTDPNGPGCPPGHPLHDDSGDDAPRPACDPCTPEHCDGTHPGGWAHQPTPAAPDPAIVPHGADCWHNDYGTPAVPTVPLPDPATVRAAVRALLVVHPADPDPAPAPAPADSATLPPADRAALAAATAAAAVAHAADAFDPLATLRATMQGRAAGHHSGHSTPGAAPTTAPAPSKRFGGQAARGGLTPTGLRMLALVRDNPGISRAGLARKTGRTKGYSALFGAHSKGGAGSVGMVDMGLCTATWSGPTADDPGGAFVYHITDAGRAALSAAGL